MSETQADPTFLPDHTERMQCLHRQRKLRLPSLILPGFLGASTSKQSRAIAPAQCQTCVRPQSLSFSALQTIFKKCWGALSTVKTSLSWA